MEAILREIDAGHIALMSPEAAEFPPGFAVPEADRVIGTAGEDAPAVGCDRDGSNRPRVALEGAPGSPVGRPPHANAIVPAALRIAPARGRPVAPRGTGDAPGDVVMTGEAADFL